MLNGYSIIDADSHVVEPPGMWLEYLEPEFSKFAPSADMKINGEQIVGMLSEQIRDLANKQMMSAHPNAYFNLYNVESQIQEMMLMGIPTYGLWIWAIDSMQPNLQSPERGIMIKTWKVCIINDRRFLSSFI